MALLYDLNKHFMAMGGRGSLMDGQADWLARLSIRVQIPVKSAGLSNRRNIGGGLRKKWANGGVIDRPAAGEKVLRHRAPFSRGHPTYGRPAHRVVRQRSAPARAATGIRCGQTAPGRCCGPVDGSMHVFRLIHGIHVGDEVSHGFNPLIFSSHH